MSSIPYRPEIDGLRAIAVVPVILFHLGLPYVPGGFIGVDVFFVISGFLITSIILSEMKQGIFSFRDFWARRIRRILPAMLFVTASTLLFTYFFGYRLEQQSIGKQGLAALLSVANIFFWLTTGDYWGTASEESPFLHAWSLSLEEQFYLFFPIAFWFAFQNRAWRIRRLITICVIASFILFAWGSQAYPEATFFLLPTRVWELGTGCLLAVSAPQEARKTKNGILAIFGLSLVLLTYLIIESLNAGVAFATIGTALVIRFGQSGLCNRLLSQRFVVHLGKLSYSLYLWHWPVIVLGKKAGIDWDGKSDAAALIAISFILASGTYHLIEKKIRRRDGIVGATLMAGFLVAVIACAMALIQRSYDTSGYESPKWVEHSCLPSWATETTPSFCNVRITNPYYKSDSFSSGRGIQIHCSDESPRIVVLGDSHANMWSDTIANITKTHQIPTAFFVINGESPFFEIPLALGAGNFNLSASDKLKYDKMRLEAIQNWCPDLIIIATRWEEETIEKSISFLSYLKSNEIPVLLIEDPPEISIPETNALQYLASLGLLTSGKVSITSREKRNKSKRHYVRKIAASFDNVKLLPTFDLYEDEIGATVIRDHVPLYLDDDHLTSQGAELISHRLRDRINAILNINTNEK